jgi:hypothetical protein
MQSNLPAGGAEPPAGLFGTIGASIPELGMEPRGVRGAMRGQIRPGAARFGR